MGLIESIRRWFKLPPDHDNRLVEAVEKIIGYSFQDRALLLLALTHRSFTKNKNNSYYSNERLEYLGDSVLGLVIAQRMARAPPQDSTIHSEWRWTMPGMFMWRIPAIPPFAK